MDLEDVQSFLEVADAGGVSPAARRLGLSKSILSRRIVRLEEALGVQLLSRTTHGTALTEAGATFVNMLHGSSPNSGLRKKRSPRR